MLSELVRWVLIGLYVGFIVLCAIFILVGTSVPRLAPQAEIGGDSLCRHTASDLAQPRSH
jgi:hypothetical protein